MVVVYHKNSRVTGISVENELDVNIKNFSIVYNLCELAQSHPDKIIVWCHEDLRPALNTDAIPTLFHHKKILFSYNNSDENFLGNQIGYVEESIFIKVNKQVQFPTWQMSGKVGAVHASVLNGCKDYINTDESLDYFLNSLAKRAMPFGLLCYSEPALLKKNEIVVRHPKAGNTLLFRFVKQHYKTRWIFLLLLNLLWHEHQFPFGAFLKSVFYRKRKFSQKALSYIAVNSNRKISSDFSIDVIIPTIGRKTHLYQVLKDLSAQGHLPVNVIVVEQNPELGSQSELDFILNEQWPFAIRHIFTHQAGACNARNVCLSHTKSNYVFLADDDNRFDKDLIKQVFEKFHQFGNDVLQVAYPQVNEKISKKPVFQYAFFGAGNAFLKRSCLENVSFDMGFEFGYGEDNDFGMQLRNHGFDVLYASDISIVHLKAPMGGFRTKPVLQWSQEKVQPKPSPTIMLFLLKHYTTEQINGYKTNSFFKFYKYQSEKNPFRYKRIFQEKWDSSVFWAKKLMQQ